MKFSPGFRAIAALLLFAGSSHCSMGQIYINEFLASNNSINQDPEYNEYADWVELYNTGTSSVNLNGYYLTDNLNDPMKWKIPQDAIIPAKGYLIIWTDGQNSGLHSSFKISALGEEIALFSPGLLLLDSVTFGSQNIDISVGRSPNGSSTWRYFITPTPGKSNNTTAYTDITFNAPEFSVRGGLYSGNQTLELSTDLGGTIRYTTDGSDPISTSTLYSSPIQINQTTIVRARIFKPNEVPGPIITNSYFINENFESLNLPVVSIATNPENFWDPAKGIYVQNFKPEWEVPINIELFEDNGSDRAAFNELAGTKINGLYSWQLPQKMLGIYFRKQYGPSSLNYHLFFEKERSGYKDFALRASGSDWSFTLFRDALIHMAIGYNMDVDYMSFRPSIVYVNGQYMGIHNIREKVDEDYIVGNYKLEKGTFDMVEYEEFAEAGDLIEYNQFKDLYQANLGVKANFDAVAAVMDIENFTDYIITELYSGNYSISHNVMTWKPKGKGKWKWILMDLDRGMLNANSYLLNTYINQRVWPFANLWENTEYKEYFAKRLASHLYTTFNKIRMLERIDYHQQLIENEISNHVDRWLGTTSSYGNAMPSVDFWNNEVEKLRDFARDRPQVLLNNLTTYGFSSPSSLTLSIYPENGGSFEFNDLKVPEGTWTGLYPKNMTFSITASNKPGYIFKGWKNSMGQSTYLSTNKTYNSTLTGSLTLVAVFEASGECIVPEIIASNTTLNKDCSPYLAQGDITIPENITLTIEPGVQIWLSPGANFTINGNIVAKGAADQRIIFKMNPSYSTQSWGALNFTQTSDTTYMDYVTIEDASHGPISITQVAAISAYKADLVLDHMILEKIYSNPIAGRYSSISLSNSSLHSEVIGDMINVKYGHGKIVNCDFRGNKMPDTDAIDYDDVENGIIKNCRIKNFEGFNNDAIDIGEKATNILIDSVFVYHVYDKGVSVGQRSSIIATNCTFIDCNLGFGLKDSCRATINHCTFYAVGIPIACYEKNPGSAGGNGYVKNSIMSNSYTSPYMSDQKSTIKIYNCISDYLELPDNGTNLYGNPLFSNPTFFDYRLATGSPSINTADDNGVLSDMGSLMKQFTEQPPVMISRIFYNTKNSIDKVEFIGILNPGTESVDLSGYKISLGVDFTFPPGVVLQSGKTVLIGKEPLGPLTSDINHKCYVWSLGSLANEGETIQIMDSNGIIVDQVTYSPDAPWPDVNLDDEKVLTLISPNYDNHFGENWTTEDYASLVTGMHESFAKNDIIYPNPTKGPLTINFGNNSPEYIKIYNMSGILIDHYPVNKQESITIDLSSYQGQILILQVGEKVEKIVVLQK